jgi:hypothetical protein
MARKKESKKKYIYIYEDTHDSKFDIIRRVELLANNAKEASLEYEKVLGVLLEAFDGSLTKIVVNK